MVLILKNDEMKDLVPMAEEIEVIEHAFREMGEGKAENSPRARLRVQAPGKEEGVQWLNGCKWLDRPISLKGIFLFQIIAANYSGSKIDQILKSIYGTCVSPTQLIGIINRSLMIFKFVFSRIDL